MEQYFASQKDNIFRNVEVLIYVFDVESRELDNDMHCKWTNFMSKMDEYEQKFNIVYYFLFLDYQSCLEAIYKVSLSRFLS